MGFKKSLENIRYFFRWIADILGTWFLPYHTDEENSATPAETDSAPDRMPKPDPDRAAPSSGTVVSPEPAIDQSRLTEAMAFRGPMTKQALAAVLGESPESVGREIDHLTDGHQLDDLGDGRYILVGSERHQILRSDPRVADWLARFQHSQLETETLDVLEEICRHLPVKISAGESLVFHLRQRKWMVWQSREETCRVRLFGTLDHKQLDHLRTVDKRLRRFHRKERHGWDGRDWVLFRWTLGADYMAVESILLEAGRQFQRHARRRRGPGRAHPRAESAETDTAADE